MQDFISSNYYDVLGVERSASFDDIKKAYRKKVVSCHPDRHPGDKLAEEEFKKISIAYKILQDPDKRKNYDLLSSVTGGNVTNNPVINDFIDAFKHIINEVTDDFKQEFESGKVRKKKKKNKSQKSDNGDYTILKQAGFEFRIKR